MTKLDYFGDTDMGLHRTNNEDAYVVRPDLDFFSVADGMGGAAAGEVASQIFIDSAQKVFERTALSSGQSMDVAVQEAFRLGNDRILEHVALNPEDEGMGCTAEIIAFANDSYIVGHVGDSRTYLFREGILRQITRDHSFVQEQVDSGRITPEEAKNHAQKNIVLRAVGISPELALDIVNGKSFADDIFLLCSDGLTDMVEDELIREVLSSSRSLPEKGAELIECAKSGGGRDNITVVLCEVLPG